MDRGHLGKRCAGSQRFSIVLGTGGWGYRFRNLRTAKLVPCGMGAAIISGLRRRTRTTWDDIGPRRGSLPAYPCRSRSRLCSYWRPRTPVVPIYTGYVQLQQLHTGLVCGGTALLYVVHQVSPMSAINVAHPNTPFPLPIHTPT
jgi:hypothetical protein